MINELVNKLKKYAAAYGLPPFGIEIEGTPKLLLEAADTIEALSAKLQAANAERSSPNYENDVFTKIIAELDNRISAELRIIAGLNDETQIYGYVRSLEAYQQSKLIVEKNIEEYKERQSEMDYGSGWIVCEDALPDDGESVLVTDGEYVYLVEYDADLDVAFGDVDNIIAWRYLPEPYKAQ